MIFSGLYGLQTKRKKTLKKLSQGALRSYYEVPFADNKSQITDVRFVAIDFESTGLNKEQDDVVSVGCVELQGMEIKLSTAYHQLIKTNKILKSDSVVIHNITDDAMSSGLDIKQVLDTLLKHLAGAVIIAHHAQIELGFLDKLCRHFYNHGFIIPYVDTLQLAQRQLKRSHTVIANKSLRLFNLRDRFNLPKYKAHHALSDALTSAELFLVLSAELYPDMKCKLGDLVSKK